jgi:hypothetical protein
VYRKVLVGIVRKKKMSKSHKDKDALGTTDTSPPGTAVDFLFRTMSKLNLLCRILASTHRVYADCIKYCVEFYSRTRRSSWKA